MAFTFNSSATTAAQALDRGTLPVTGGHHGHLDGLPGLDLGRVPGRAAHVHHLAGHGHAEGEILVDQGFVGHRPIHEMHRLRRLRRTFGHQILIELLGKERRERRE